MLNAEDLKQTDWLIGKSLNGNIRPMIRLVKDQNLYFPDGGLERSISSAVDQIIIDDCGYKYLTIKTEAIQQDTVIYCSEKWMAEALCWAADRLGYKWSNGRNYFDYTYWSDKKTCYHLYNGTHLTSAKATTYNYKIIPFWEAVTGEEKKENKMEKLAKGEKVTSKYNTQKIYTIVIPEPDADGDMIVKDERGLYRHLSIDTAIKIKMSPFIEVIPYITSSPNEDELTISSISKLFHKVNELVHTVNNLTKERYKE